MSAQLTLLPRRSPLLPGESLLSLLVRLEKLNYYEPGIIARLCHQTTDGSKEMICPAHARQAHTFVQLSNLTGLDPAQLFAASIHGLASVLNMAGNKEYITLPGGQVKPLLDRHNHLKRPDNHAQFCPLCIEADAYHRQLWSFYLTTLCLEHQCKLVRQCPGCGHEISVAQVVSRRCQICQADLRQTPVTSVASDTWDLASQQLVQRWLTTALASASPLDGASRGQVKNGAPHCELLTKKQVMQALRLSEGAVTRLAKSGTLRQARVPMGETFLVMFRSDRILATAQEWKRGMPIGDVCRWLNLTRPVIANLVRNKLLRLARGSPHDSHHMLLNQQSITTFVQAIADKLKPIQEANGYGLSLAGATQRLSGVRLDRAMLLKMMAEGQMQGYCWGPWRDNLMTIHFTQSSIDSLVQATVARHNWVSDAQLAWRLGTNTDTLRSWKRERWWDDNGLWPAARYGHTAYFEQQAVERFCANCLTSTQAASLLGISRARLMQQYVYGGRLRAIADPRRDGSRRYLFWRRNVEWLQ